MTNTESDAAKEARAAAYDQDDRERDEPGVTELGHVHGPGLGLACHLEKSVAQFKAAVVEAGDEHMVCDCLALYDVEEGCAHGYFACHQCKLERCAECRAEVAEMRAVDIATDRWRS